MPPLLWGVRSSLVPDENRAVELALLVGERRVVRIVGAAENDRARERLGYSPPGTPGQY